MYYKLKKGCFIRRYGEYGYITSTGIYNDQIFDNNGAVFLLALSRTPQLTTELAEKIASYFNNVTPEEIIRDVEEFFDNLVVDGFVVSGNTIDECNEKDVGFQYALEKEKGFYEDFTPITKRTNKNTQEVLKKQLLLEPRIGSFQMEITSKCNERCIHCYIPYEYKVSTMKSDLFYKVLDELEEMNILNLTLSGGEPMLHPNFVEFLKAAKERDFSVGVLSNLTLLNDDIVDVLKEGNTSYVQVSLYSMIPEHHDAITTVKGSFEKTKNAILKLIDNNVPVQISCPIMKINKNDYIEVAKWAFKNKIRITADYSIMAEYNHDTSNLKYRLSPQECKDFMKKLIEIDKDYQDSIMSMNFEDEIKKLKNNGDEPFCGVGISTCCMVANGDVFPCPGWQSMVCGNLYIDTLQNIWKNSKEINYLRSLRKKDIPKCMNCKDKAFCSPCLVRFSNESPTSNPLEVPEYFCEVAAMNKEVVDEWKAVNTK